MSNELKKIVKRIQFKTDKTIEEIAKDIGYARAYFTNQINIGTNKNLKGLLEKYLLDYEQNVLPVNEIPVAPIPRVNEDPAVYNKVLPLGDLKVTLKDYVDLLRDKAIKAEEREREYLDIIKKKLISIDANSKEIADDISALTTENQAAHRAIMDSVDVAAGQPIGTSRGAAGIVEIASEQERVGTDKKVMRK